MIEHPRGYETVLKTPSEADETTPLLLRFRRQMPPHNVIKLTVVLESRGSEEVEILSKTGASNCNPISSKAAFPRSFAMPCSRRLK